MTPRNVCLGIILILASSCAFAADPDTPITAYPGRSEFRATGSATNIDSRAFVFNIVDHGDTFTILADHATFQLIGGKFGTIRDLRDYANVRVTGEQLSARTVLASAVIVLDDTGVRYDGAQAYRPNDHVETSGYVTRVDAQLNEISIRTQSGNYVVIVRTGTVIRRYIYVTDIKDINEGDNISLTGTMDSEGKIAADRIQVSASNPDEHGKYPIGKGYRPRTLDSARPASEDTIEGTVAYPASSFDRTLGLDTRYGDRKVDVSKSAEVLIDRRSASVHDLLKGDKVRAAGTWSGTTLVASRLETIDQFTSSTTTPAQTTPEPPPAAAPAQPAPEPPPAVETPPPAEPPAEAQPPVVEQPRPSDLTGRIIEIDYAKSEFSMDAGMKDNKIDAADAAVTRKGSTRRFSELKKGDKVEVKGDWNGDVLKAVSVDVVE